MAGIIKNVYLGTWFPRTSLHLREIYDFFNYGEGIVGLDKDKIKYYYKNLELNNISLHQETDFDFILAQYGEIDLTVTEDGIILLHISSSELKMATNALKKFYDDKLAPAISYLFSRGAPLPREIATVDDIMPFLIVGEKFSQVEVGSLLAEFGEKIDSKIINKDIELYFAKKIEVINVLSANKSFVKLELEFLRTLIFFREFEFQLNSYLQLHRDSWEKISDIRERRTIRYRDFHRVREEILDYLEAMSFVKARLAQMDDILYERQHSSNTEVLMLLEGLSLDRFTYLGADREYISHLWQMTTEYVNGTLSLLESLFNEHTQKEITTLKYVTLVGVLTSFFGMNIAFPWEERWPAVFVSSIEVVFLILLMAVGFYYFLKFFVYNRRFIIRKK